MSDVFDVTATVRLPTDGKATVELHSRLSHASESELTDDERQTIEDVLIAVAARRQAGRHA